nr:hypothetical protein CFP56_22381 [Quercus suber]
MFSLAELVANSVNSAGEFHYHLALLDGCFSLRTPYSQSMSIHVDSLISRHMSCRNSLPSSKTSMAEVYLSRQYIVDVTFASMVLNGNPYTTRSNGGKQRTRRGDNIFSTIFESLTFCHHGYPTEDSDGRYVREPWQIDRRTMGAP